LAASPGFVYTLHWSGGGLIICDVSDPCTPQCSEVEEDLGGDLRDVVVVGGHAYVATDGGLTVVDVADPTSPQVVASSSFDGAGAIASCGGDLLVTVAWWTGEEDYVRVFDVSDPEAPLQLGSASVSGAYDVACSVDRAFAATATGPGPDEWPDEWHVAVFDLSDPTAPVEGGRFENPVPSGHLNAVAATGQHALVAGQDELRVIDASDPDAPTEVWSQGAGLTDSADVVALAGSLAYVAGEYGGLDVVDLTVPDSPVVLGALEMDWEAPRDAIVMGNLVLVLSEHELHLIDASNPSAPVEVGLHDGLTDGRSLASRGTHVVVADGDGGLQVVDASDPTAPHWVASVGGEPYAWPALDVAVSGVHAFVSALSDGLKLIDLTDPSTPVAVRSWDEWISHQVEVADGVAYLSVDASSTVHDDEWVVVLDVSSPAAPVELTMWRPEEYAQCYELALAGSVLCMRFGCYGWGGSYTRAHPSWSAPS
jgi:hypothetical protein